MGRRRMPTGPVTRTFLEKEPQRDPWAPLVTERAGPGEPSDARRPPAARADNAALQKLCRGLGVEMPRDPNFDWEGFGGSVRHVVQCLGDHLTARANARREIRAEEPTMIGARESNPLKAGMRTREMLQYLFFAPQGIAGWTPAPQALREMSEEARSHEAATRSAARGLAEGAIREFDPAKLRGSLLQGKLSLRLVDNARLWDLYTTDYDNRSHNLAEWSEQLFNRYYMAGYLREVERLRRARMPAPRQRTR
jgi:predicted component of type VI protein secretion system